jgi:hypothetical protein
MFSGTAKQCCCASSCPCSTWPCNMNTAQLRIWQSKSQHTLMSQMHTKHTDAQGVQASETAVSTTDVPRYIAATKGVVLHVRRSSCALAAVSPYTNCDSSARRHATQAMVRPLDAAAKHLVAKLVANTGTAVQT